MDNIELKAFYEEHVPYVVRLNNSLPCTTIYKEFCGYLIGSDEDKYYFEINGNRMNVVVPKREVKFMAPSKVFLNKFYKEKEKLTKEYKEYYDPDWEIK